MTRGLVVDLFAGGGGASVGIEAALGRPVDVAINHDATALAVHRANHPGTRHLEADIWEVRPAEATGGRPVELLWASPDCTYFSIAKGDVPLRQDIRSLAWAVVRWAAAVQPAVIILENVSEFRSWGPLGADGRPVKRRMGATFLRWRGKLMKLGYVVDLAVLNSKDYGAPTARKRLFIVARRDGLAIRWPEPTHGPGLLPVRTAAECIDWALPCPSIFERKRPLAPKTLWRIAEGIRRFVLENPRPFLVRMAHWEVAPDGVTRRRGHGSQDLDAPLPTVTGGGGGGGFAIATPSLAVFRHDSTGAAIDRPMPTLTAGGKPRPGRPATGNPIGVLAPILSAAGGPARSGNPRSAEEPLATVMPANNRVLVAPSLIKVNHGKPDARCESIQAPLTTVTATQRGHALVSSTLMQMGHGEREGQAARLPGLDKPLGTVTAGGRHHALVSAFLARHFGGVVGCPAPAPLPTITARDHHSLVTASLEARDDVARRGTADDRGGRDRGPTGRDRLEAPEHERDTARRATTNGDAFVERLPEREGLPGRAPVRDDSTPAGVDRSTWSDTGGHGDQPQGRREDEQPSGQPGSCHRQREQPPRLSHARPEAAEVDSEACPGPGGAARQGVEGGGPELLGDRSPAGRGTDDSVPSREPAVAADHTREVRAFLTLYYGSGSVGQRVDVPLRTVTAKHRLGLVTVEGTEYQIVDIGMRMLEPHELLRAQFGRFAETYDLGAATTKASKVRLIGNSVCPEVAEAVVASNLPEGAEAEGAA